MRQHVEIIVHIDAGAARIEGMLAVPEGAQGLVLFAHGSGSSRFSPRNQYVAKVLSDGGLGTLLIDLLDPNESDDRRKVFDIGLLAERLKSATHWIRKNPDTAKLNIGYFGASTGAAAALQAAAEIGPAVKAIVSRGGRPDLALQYLRAVKSPTLLIVGGDDYPVIPLNQQAYGMLSGPKELAIIPGATHLFEESGALEQVATRARNWFLDYLGEHAGEISPAI